jgi:hypothetical protein
MHGTNAAFNPGLSHWSGINVHQELLTQVPFFWLHPMISMELQPFQYQFVSSHYCKSSIIAPNYLLAIHLKGKHDNPKVSN